MLLAMMRPAATSAFQAPLAGFPAPLLRLFGNLQQRGSKSLHLQAPRGGGPSVADETRMRRGHFRAADLGDIFRERLRLQP